MTNESDNTGDDNEPDASAKLEPTPEPATGSASAGVSGDSPAEVSILSLTDEHAAIDSNYQKGPDGSVITGRNGLPKRRPGRPRKNPDSISGGAATAPTVSPSSTPAVSKSPAQRRAAKVSSDELSRALVNTSIGALVGLIGPEMDFESPEEAQGVKAAVSAYIEAKGDGNLSPETMLALVVAGYAMPRARHPNVREKVGGFFAGIWGFITKPFKRS